jgi:ABC-type sugar transport system ATPase subunit
LLDEPLTNIDPELKSKLLLFIKHVVIQTKACLVYVTHDVAEAQQISSRVLTLTAGRLDIGINEQMKIEKSR